MVRYRRISFALLIVLMAAVSITKPASTPVQAQDRAGQEWIFSWQGSYTTTDNEDYPSGVRSYYSRTSTTHGSARLEELPNRRASVYDYNHFGYAEWRLQVFDGNSENCFMLDDYEVVRDPAFLQGREFSMSFEPPVQQADGSWRLRLNDTLLRSDQAVDFPAWYASTYVGMCKGGSYDEFEADTESVQVLSEFDTFIPYLESVNGEDFFARVQITRNGQPDQYGNVPTEQFVGQIGARKATCPTGNGPFQGQAADLRALELELLPQVNLAPLSSEQAMASTTSQMMVRATCKGIPVVNAQIDVTIEPIMGSGGHEYHEGRPRGSINGVRLSDARPSVSVTTDAAGYASISLQPGKDTRNGTLMIAGAYTVKASSVRYPDVQDMLVETFKVEGLTPLQPTTDLVKIRRDTFGYQDAYNGTPITNQVIQQVAADYRAYQHVWNDTREALGQSREPLLPLDVNDISLPWGGLFPTIGWDEQLGRITGKPWQPPHYTHTDGRVVDITLNRARFSTFENPTNAYIRHRAWLREILSTYGQPLSNTTLTYRIHQSTPISATQATIGTPDLLVDGFIQREVPAAAAGQVASIGLSVSNLAGNAAATNTMLSVVLPRGVSLVQAIPAPSSQDGQQLTWELDRLEVAAIVPVQLDVRLDADLAAGSLLPFSVTARSSQADLNPANNQIVFPLTIQTAGPDLVLDSNLHQVMLTGDRPVTVTLELSNLGNAPAPATQVLVTLPKPMWVNTGTHPIDARSQQEIAWNLGEVAVDQRRTISFTIQPSGIGTVPIPIVLAATTTATDIDRENNQLTVIKPVERLLSDPAIRLTLVGANDGSIRAGEPFTLLVDYANYAGVATGVTTATLQLDPGLRLINAVPAAHDQNQPQQISWKIGNLAAQRTGQMVVQLQADTIPATGLMATIRLTTDSPDRNGANNSDSVQIAVRPATPTAPPASFTLQLPLVIAP